MNLGAYSTGKNVSTSPSERNEMPQKFSVILRFYSRDLRDSPAPQMDGIYMKLFLCEMVHTTMVSEKW